MRTFSPFQADDLAELDTRLLSLADRVVAMEDIAGGDTDRGVIGLRHDVDNVIVPAVDMAEWEAERGYRSTYFVLHTAPYWADKTLLRTSLERIASLGHEIGLHANALTEALETGVDPHESIALALAELRGYGYDVHGVVAHGDSLCRIVGFVNDEIFVESPRPDVGAPDRLLEYLYPVRLRPVPRAAFGLDYDPNWLSRVEYLSDSGGEWRPTPDAFDVVAERFPDLPGQLHMLVHPDWWGEAFAAVEVAA